MSIWDYYTQHPDDARHFANAMGNISAVVAQYDFSAWRTIVERLLIRST
jgi:hypothetical protein